MRCGSIRVEESPGVEGTRSIDLKLVVLASTTGTSPSALVPLDGGPGAAATTDAEFYLDEGQAYREGRDVVLLDMRGTGDSAPLSCPRLERLEASPQDHFTDMYPIDDVRDCRDRLAPSADLSAYHTGTAVADLEQVRARLGYEQFDLQGTSYGTRLATEYLRQHPERVRSVTLLGALSREHTMPGRHAAGFQRALEMWFDACEADATCASRFPRLRESWRRTLERLDEAPARVELDDDGAVEVRREVFVEKIRSQFYLATQALALPPIVEAAAAGDFTPFVDLVVPDEPATRPFIFDGAYLSFTCTEDVPFLDPAEIDAARRLDLGDSRIVQQQRACDEWPRGRATEGLRSAFRSTVPALLVTGDADPVTPPSEAESLAQVFEASRLLVLPHTSHMPWDVDPACLDRILLDFLSDPRPEALDVECALDRAPLPFSAD